VKILESKPYETSLIMYGLRYGHGQEVAGRARVEATRHDGKEMKWRSRRASHLLSDLRLAVKRKGIGGLSRDIPAAPGKPGHSVLQAYRWLYLHGHTFLADLGYRLNFFLCDVEINPDADIGPDFHLDHALAVLIGRGGPVLAGGSAITRTSRWGPRCARYGPFHGRSGNTSRSTTGRWSAVLYHR